MNELVFPEPDRANILEKIRKIRAYGKPLRSNRNLACRMCHRSVLPLGRLAWPGAPLCLSSGCDMIPLPSITRVFVTPYGRALNQQILRIFCRTLEQDRILIQRTPIMDRAEALTDGYLELLEWQRAYHDYDRLTHPEDYALGRVSLVPPRRLDEVLIFRATEMPMSTDPTKDLPSEQSRLLHRVKNQGPNALAVPF